jgi:polysaccharide deacetylase family protein (PEP-CTERM system associated)
VKNKSPVHLFTVDVEEYFQVSAFAGHIERVDWERLPSRVEDSTRTILEELDGQGVFGTFFVLGWVAERNPALVRAIADAGHEVASHGFWHRRLGEMTTEEFRLDLRRSKAVLEDLTGRPVYGYRAPSFSIVPGREWAFDVLVEEGYTYDSSLFPIQRTDYGYPSAHPQPHVIRRNGGELLELPMATVSLAGLRLPAAGGAYLRLLPFNLIRRAFLEHGRDGPGVFYLHPWELDPDQPRLSLSPLTRLRHYGGLAKTLSKVRRLLGEFSFTSIERRYALRETGCSHECTPLVTYG